MFLFSGALPDELPPPLEPELLPPDALILGVLPPLLGLVLLIVLISPAPWLAT